MGKQETIVRMERANAAVPVQWCFKSHLPDGRQLDVIFRRVKAGNDTPLEVHHEGESYLHLRGRYHDAATLLEHLDDELMPQSQAGWIEEAMIQCLNAMADIAEKKPALLALFAPKGKMEIYLEGRFSPQYISGNHTMKLSIAQLREDATCWVSHLMAQHLDYPFGPGERRYSTSRLFDLCFTAEKVIAPKGLAVHIDAQLAERGIFNPDKQVESDYDHVSKLLDHQSAAIRTSYERVLQRERFAAMMAAIYLKPSRHLKAPLLRSFCQLIEVDLLAQEKNNYKDYPTKGMDQLATAMHVPLMMIFNKAGKHDRATTGTMGSA